MHKEHEKILKYNHGETSLKAPFKMVALSSYLCQCHQYNLFKII